MRIWMKISLLCISLYVTVLGIVGLYVIEKSYQDALSREIESFLNEEEKAHLLLAIQLDPDKQLLLEEGKKKSNSTLSARPGYKPYEIIAKMLGGKGTRVEVYNSRKEILYPGRQYEWGFKRQELDVAIKGDRNYVLRRSDGKLFLFVTDILSNRTIISLSRDISYLDSQRKEQFLFFTRVTLLGLVLLSIIAPIVSRFITKPLDKLAGSIGSIISGNYKERVQVLSKDEAGALAVQFNKMASEIDIRIEELALQGEKKQKFIDNLIHEMRTPLTSIIGYTDFLMTNRFSEELLLKSLSSINSEGKRLLEVSEKLMGLILLNDPSTVSLNNVNVKELLEEIICDMRAKAESKGIHLNAEDTGLHIIMDRTLIKSVITNLIDNSIYASEKGSSIVAGACIYEGVNSIYVKDEGKGIPAKELENVLEPFYRVDRARSRKDGGAGLGLSICREIAQAHGAELKIESRHGKGTVVRIIFRQKPPGI